MGIGQGGKSGASFFRTNDKRFIIKTMSTFEINSFYKFAPAYFAYVATGRKAGKPSALCKVYGVYKVGSPSPSSSLSRQQTEAVVACSCG